MRHSRTQQVFADPGKERHLRRSKCGIHTPHTGCSQRGPQSSCCYCQRWSSDRSCSSYEEAGATKLKNMPKEIVLQREWVLMFAYLSCLPWTTWKATCQGWHCLLRKPSHPLSQQDAMFCPPLLTSWMGSLKPGSAHAEHLAAWEGRWPEAWKTAVTFLSPRGSHPSSLWQLLAPPEHTTVGVDGIMSHKAGPWGLDIQKE